jgi:hypothetical protein
MDHVEGWDRCQLEVLEQKKMTEDTTWVQLNLLTGRTHQIRAQMAHDEGADFRRCLVWFKTAIYGERDRAEILRNFF